MKKANEVIIKLIPFLIILIPIWCFFTVVLYFLSPGLYSVDETMLLDEIKKGGYYYWQYWYHFLTGILYKTIYSIFHTEIAIVFVLISFYSFALSFIIYKFTKIFSNKKYLLSFLIFLTPPILTALFCPSRISIYSFLIWFFMCLIFCKYNDRQNITYKNIFLASLLTSLLVTYRSEGFIFLILLPISLFFIFKKRITLKKYIIYLLLFIIMSSSIIFIQSKGNNISKYNMVPFSYEFERMLRDYENLNITQKEIEYIEKYIKIEDVKNFNYSADYAAENLFNNPDFKKLYIDLLKRNFDEFIKSRKMLMRLSTVWHGNLVQNVKDENKKFVCKLQFQDEACNDYNSKNIHFFDFLYSVNFIMFLLIILCVLSIIKKNIFYIFLSLWQTAYFALLFLTAPVAFYDYYLPLYICTLFFITLLPFIKLNNFEK